MATHHSSLCLMSQKNESPLQTACASVWESFAHLCLNKRNVCGIVIGWPNARIRKLISGLWKHYCATNIRSDDDTQLWIRRKSYTSAHSCSLAHIRARKINRFPINRFHCAMVLDIISMGEWGYNAPLILANINYEYRLRRNNAFTFTHLWAHSVDRDIVSERKGAHT